MRTIKENGWDELQAFKRRVERARALGRISPRDCQSIVKRVQAIESIIVSMEELNEQGEYVGEDSF